MAKFVERSWVFMLLFFACFAFSVHIVYGAGTPASTIITTGGDNGDSTPNLPSECMMSFKNANDQTDTVISSQTSLTVDTGFDLQLLSFFGLPLDDTRAIGETVVFRYVIQNLGNATDNIKIETSIVGGVLTWPIKIVIDSNQNGLYEATSDSIETNVLNLSADAIDTILVLVNIPDTAQNLDTCAVKVTVADSFGLGAVDGWPESDVANARDTQTHTFVVTAARSVVYLAKYVSTSGTEFVSTSAHIKPGDTVWFTLVYDNDGIGTGTQIVITDNIDTRLEFVAGSANDTNYIHSASPIDTVQANIGTIAAPNWVDASSVILGGSVVQLRWALNATLEQTQGDTVGAANYSAGQADKGYVYFKARVK